MPLPDPRALGLALLLVGPLAHAAAADNADAQAAHADWPEWLRPTPSGDYWRAIASPYTAHFHKDNDGEHENVYLIGVERQYTDGWLWGVAPFSNSFGQPSVYGYVGEQVIGFSRWPELYAKWTAGIVYGYVGEYRDKVPFNVGGFAPAIIVGLGWQFTREFSMQANLLGAAGLMFQFSWDLR